MSGRVISHDKEVDLKISLLFNDAVKWQKSDLLPISSSEERGKMSDIHEFSAFNVLLLATGLGGSMIIGYCLKKNSVKMLPASAASMLVGDPV